MRLSSIDFPQVAPYESTFTHIIDPTEIFLITETSRSVNDVLYSVLGDDLAGNYLAFLR